MRMLLLFAAASLMLAGCTPNMQNALDKACSTASTAYSAYTIAAEGKLVPDRIAVRVDAAWKGVRVVCENKPATTEQAVLTVTAAVVVFTNAYREVK